MFQKHSLKHLTQDREYSKPLIIISSVMLLLGLSLVGLMFFLPSTLQYRDIVLVFGGFLLGFLNLIVVEVAVSSIDRAQFSKLKIKLEKQLDSRQHDTALLSCWAAKVAMLNTISKEQRTILNAACDRIRFPLNKLNNYESNYKNKQQVLPIDQNLIKINEDFNQEVVLILPDMHHIYEMIRFATFTSIILNTVANSLNSLPNIEAEFKNLINDVDLYIEEFELSKEDLVGEFKKAIFSLTDEFLKLQSILNNAVEKKEYKNPSKLSKTLLEINDKVQDYLLLAIAPV